MITSQIPVTYLKFNINVIVALLICLIHFNGRKIITANEI